MKPLDVRQSEYRGILQELFPWASGKTLDILMASVNSDLTPPLKIDATSTPSLTINVGPSVVTNPESSRNKSISFIGNSIPSFAGGTITFPSTSGGNITTSTGGTFPLTLPSGDYVQVLLELDSNGNLQVSIGVPNASPSAALVPSQSGPVLAFGYVTLQNIAGTIQNVTQSNIYYFSGGNSSSPTSWVAKKVALASGSKTASFSFSTPQPDLSYVVLTMMGNTADAHPQFQQVEVTSKTISGFSVKWNVALDTANYFLCYVVPPKTVPQSETSIGSGMATISTNQNGIGWVLAQLQNTVDANPQFQPIVVGSNSGISSAPTVQTFLSGSGTYTLPSQAPLYIRVRMVGGGGGGGGSSTGAITSGSSGTATTFGTSLLTAGGGSGAILSSGGAGGSASLGTGPIGITLGGGSGQGASTEGSINIGLAGSVGASSYFGGGGARGAQSAAGESAVSNTGSGGQGGGASTASETGAGGGAGGFVDAIITNPLPSYNYTVGSGGAGGIAGSGGYAGGNGAAGIIIVEEYYAAGNNSNNSSTVKWNTNTDTANYVVASMVGGTGQIAITNGTTSATVTLPVSYGAASYAIIATVQNTVDSHPQFQPLVVTAQNPGSATISWNAPRDTGNYLLNYYAISLTS